MSRSNASARTQDHTLNPSEREKVDYNNKTNEEVAPHPDKSARAIDAERSKEVRPKPEIDESNSNIHHQSRIFTAGHLDADIDNMKQKHKSNTTKLNEPIDTSDNVSNQGFNHKPSSNEELDESEPKQSEGLFDKAKHALEGAVSMIKPLSSTTETDEYRDMNEKARLKAIELGDKIRSKKLEKGGSSRLPNTTKFHQYVEDLEKRAQQMEQDAMKAIRENARQSEKSLKEQAEKEKLELENANLMNLREETTANKMETRSPINTEEDEVNVLKRLQEDARKWGVMTDENTTEGRKDRLEEKLVEKLPAAAEMKEQMHKPVVEEKDSDSGLTTLKVKETLNTLKDQAKSILTTIDQLALEFKGDHNNSNDEKESDLMSKSSNKREMMDEDRKSSGKGRPESIDHKQVELDVARLGEETES